MKILLEDDESLNPMLSVTNLVDVFLVVIAALLVAIAQNPLNPFTTENVTVIKNAGEPNMEIIIKNGEEINHYKTTGEIGQGQGSRAGITYKMKDGSMVYVPENQETD
ncbi:MAG: DUF2149 domain-containing protein [Candidatus Thiodiazotropha sp.]|jgi:hypothetical protein